ncbi:NADH-ubiquinone oxidoreductase subunit G-like protein [Leptotrombidium deliense]|uniref:NADH-ubiquinone oxidoreductase 75 kDa subunit, mitochondrial n=1 Tax=Leptotrombidium deliense TaxID=299467 RepID=A0A443SJA0_9ACAR|nr:NADH-ubiquinone oxidoreductase subunit G-like protein [Leptotrombidium deliense]
MFRLAVTYCGRSTKNGCETVLLKQCRRRASTTDIKKQTAAAATNQEKPKLLEVFIDDKKVLVEPGTTILEAAAMVGVEIPRFCYHERLSVAGNCRMCLVEVEKSVKPVASCAMPIMMNGTKVKTDSPMTKQAREGVMEFLLMNHPLDCPICDQGGECDLQDQSMAFGSDRSRLQITFDPKRAVEDKNIGPLVKTIMTRCIHCTRCVRFMNEVAGCDDLGTTGRGSDMQIGTYLENTALLSELSGNIVDLCPVGALTSKPYAFTARPWELRRVDSVDVLDAVGSNIVVCSRAGDLMRILPRVNDAVNEEWLSDKARHAPVDGLKNQRLTVPLIKPSRNSPLQMCDWEDALLTVARALNTVHPSKMSAIVGPFVDAETMVVVKDLFNTIGSENLYVHVDSDLDASCLPSSKDIDFRKNYLFNSTIAGLEDDVDLLLLVGSNPRFEAPLLNARIRKAWRNNFINDIAVIGEKGLDLKYDYEHLGDSAQTLVDIISGKHKFAERLKKSKRTVVILGQQILQNGSETKAYDLVNSLCEKYGAEFNLLHANASQVAAFDLGFKPSSERKIDSADEQSLLWLFGVDDAKLEIPKNCYVIYQGHTGDVCANNADVVLPGCAFTEKQGTMVNMEGRVQQTMSAITPPNLAREDWKIVRACAEVSNNFIPYDTLLELRERMKQLAPHLVKHNSRTIEVATLNAPLKTSVSNEGSGPLLPRMKTLLDYWQTDAISRCSPTMSKCVVSVKKELEKRSIKN